MVLQTAYNALGANTTSALFVTATSTVTVPASFLGAKVNILQQKFYVKNSHCRVSRANVASAQLAI